MPIGCRAPGIDVTRDARSARATTRVAPVTANLPSEPARQHRFVAPLTTAYELPPGTSAGSINPIRRQPFWSSHVCGAATSQTRFASA